MCESDLQNMEYMIRCAMSKILEDQQTEALSCLIKCLETISEYL